MLSNVLPDWLKAELDSLINQLIGPAAGLEATGTTAFANSDRAHPVHNTKSAFHMATSYEQPRGTHGVAADMKIKDDDYEDEWLVFRKRLLKVGDIVFTLSMNTDYHQHSALVQTMGFRQAPGKNVRALENHGKVSNMPEVGCEGNVMFTAQQLNQAPAVLLDQRKCILVPLNAFPC